MCWLLSPTLFGARKQPEPPALPMAQVTPPIETQKAATALIATPEPKPITEGVLVPSGLSATELERGLLYDLKQYAPCFIEAEQDTGINAVFLASVAALESGWAKSNVASTKNNLFGWTSKSGYRSFDSKEECISLVAERIKALYLTPEGEYFNGYTVEDINKRYNGAPQWAEQVNQIMSEVTNRIEESKES